MLTNGREILITLKRWDNWDKNFETEINKEELTDYINKWMTRKTWQTIVPIEVKQAKI